MAAYAVFLVTSTWIFKHEHPVGPIAWLLAVLPALPLVGVILIVGIYLAEEKDEFQRNVQIQAMVWSMGATLTITTVWGFLENFLNITHLELYLVFPIFAFFEGVVAAILRTRYR